MNEESKSSKVLKNSFLSPGPNGDNGQNSKNLSQKKIITEKDKESEESKDEILIFSKAVNKKKSQMATNLNKS
jgi:hypothetical protein